MRKFAILLILLLMVFVLGCESKSEDTIIGAWDDGLGEITEFAEDGSIYISGVKELEYKIIEEGKIEVLDPYFNSRKVYEYAFKDGKLLFLDRELERADSAEVDHDHDGDGHQDH